MSEWSKFKRIWRIKRFSENHANCLVHFVVDDLGQTSSMKVQRAVLIYEQLVDEFIENLKIDMNLFSSARQAAELLIDYSRKVSKFKTTIGLLTNKLAKIWGN